MNSLLKLTSTPPPWDEDKNFKKRARVNSDHGPGKISFPANRQVGALATRLSRAFGTRAYWPECHQYLPSVGGVGRRFGSQALLRFDCLREAATAKAGHTGVAFRPTITRGLAFTAILVKIFLNNIFAFSMPNNVYS